MKDKYSKLTLVLAVGSLLFLVAYSVRQLANYRATRNIARQHLSAVQVVQSKSVDAVESVDDDEYAIYSIALTAQDYVDKHTTLLVIKDHTSIQPVPSIYPAEMKITQYTLDDYIQKNRDSAALAPKLNLQVKYKLVSATEIETLFQKPATGWEQFHSVFSGTKGLIAVSRVGFDSTKSQALLYVSIACDFTCGNGRLISFVKRKGRWHIQSTKLTHVL